MWGAAAVVILVAGAMVWVGARWWDARSAARLPAPPSGSYSAAVADHLAVRYAAARSDPSSIGAVGGLCIAYHANMIFDEAEQCYALAAELEPANWHWIYYRALIDSERGGGDTLVAYLREVVSKAPQFALAWQRLGDAEFKAGRYDAAAEAWRRARELPEESGTKGSPPHLIEVPVEAYASLGLARIALVRGEVDSARQTLEGVVARAPQFGSAFRLLAETYDTLRRPADAARALRQANRLPPYPPYVDPMVDVLARETRHSTFLLRLASEANLSINAEWSEFLTRRALEFDPENPDVVVKLGRVLRTVGRDEEALEYFRQYHAMVPGDYQGLAHIGSALSALGRYAEAESYLRRALSGLDDPVTHYNLGLLMAITGRSDEAIDAYTRALERDPGHADARTNLAAALARQGRLAQAATELLRVLERDPENALAHANLGLVRLQQGQMAQARASLERALQIDPRLAPAASALASIDGRDN